MALAIATNNAAIRAAAAASSVNRDMETSMNRLSSGKRINSASDDAAGVAISSRLTAEIRGTNQAVRNALDGQALLDTAEGAHQEVENILQRMREITVQAANDTNNQQDRDNLQAELNALSTEINRIASTTTWAGTGLLSGNGSGGLGTSTDFSFQVGANTSEADRISVQINAMSTEALGFESNAAVAAVPQIGGEAQAVTISAGTNSTASGSTISLDSTTVTSGGEAQAVNINSGTNSTAAGPVFSLNTQTVTSGGDSQAVTIADGKQTMTAGNVISIDTEIASGFVINGSSPSGYAGSEVSGAGDVNGDGLDDLILLHKNTGPGENRTSSVVFGKTDGKAIELSSLETHSTSGGFTIYGAFGDVSGAGDVNGDGFDDVIVGDPIWSPNGGGSGTSAVVFGKPNGTAVELSDLDASPISPRSNYYVIPQRFGDEFQVNTHTTGEQTKTNIASLSGGGFVATWMSNGQDGSGEGVYGQIYDASGNAVGSEFLINSETNSDQDHPSVTGLSDGGFVVAWESTGQDGSGDGVYGQRYDASAAPIGPEFQINTHTASEQRDVHLASLEGGGFVANWISYNQDGNIWGIYGQRFDSSGNAAGAEFRINTHTANNQQSAHITSLPDGGFLAMFGSDSSTHAQPDTSFFGAYGQRYDASGNPVGTEFRINTYTSNHQGSATATGLTDGGFVISWSSYGQDEASSWGIYGQRYDASGTAVGSEFKVNSNNSNDQHYSSITSLDDGGFLVVWQSSEQDGSGAGIYGQRYDSSGTKVSSEFLINSTLSNDQTRPSVTSLSDGKIVVAWNSDGQDGDANGIFAQMFDSGDSSASSGFIINGVSASDFSGYSVSGAGDVNGDGFDDVIVGAYNDDPNGNSSGASTVVFGKADSSAVELSAIEANSNSGGFVINGSSALESSGYRVSGAGDVNGDGLDDLIVGSHIGLSSASTAASTVIFGKADGTAVELSAVGSSSNSGGFVINADPDDQDESRGYSVSGAGDVNGDGLADLIVGNVYDNNYAGSSTVIFGKADGAAVELSAVGSSSNSDGFVINGVSENDASGYSVSGAGDVNGDGLADLIVGAANDGPNGNYSGASTVVFGKADGTAVELSAIESSSNPGGFVINGVSADEASGVSVSGAGDVNGDGLDDLIVGAWRADPNGTESGAGYVVFGKADGTAVELSDVESGTGTEAALASDVSVVVHNKTLTVDLSAHHDGSTNDYYGAAETIAAAINNDSDLQALDYSAVAATLAQVNAGTYAAGDIFITRADTPTTTTTTLVGNAASFVVEGITVNTDLSSYNADLSSAAAAVASDINANTDLQALDYSAVADGGTPGDIIISRADTATTSSTTLAGNSVSVVIEGVTVTIDVTAYTSDLSGAASAVAAAINADGSLQALDYSATVNSSNPGDIVISRANTPITQPYVPAIPATTAMSLTSGDSARNATAKIDNAIKTVNIQRSKLGAVSNRLSHTVNNLTNISSNLSAAQGGIEDADFAKETTDLAKNQILQQASTAMLAQANASKQNVLSLLQG